MTHLRTPEISYIYNLMRVSKYDQEERNLNVYFSGLNWPMLPKCFWYIYKGYTPKTRISNYKKKTFIEPVIPNIILKYTKVRKG